MSSPDKVQISFEMGDGKALTFGKTKTATQTDPYRILANNWVNDYGIITYEGKQYYIAFFSGAYSRVLHFVQFGYSKVLQCFLYHCR